MTREQMTPQQMINAAAWILLDYTTLYPAFRAKPVGAPHSPERRKQEHRMAVEDAAKKWLERVQPEYSE